MEKKNAWKQQQRVEYPQIKQSLENTSIKKTKKKNWKTKRTKNSTCLVATTEDP